jgi:hypothetical protein
VQFHERLLLAYSYKLATIFQLANVCLLYILTLARPIKECGLREEIFAYLRWYDYIVFITFAFVPLCTGTFIVRNLEVEFHSDSSSLWLFFLFLIICVCKDIPPSCVYAVLYPNPHLRQRQG